MGKINKHSNLYDKNGKLLKKAPLTDYTIQELEELIDSLPEGVERNNATMYLVTLYQKYGNPHEEELIKRIKEQANNTVNEDQIKQALGDLKRELHEIEQPEEIDESEEDAKERTVSEEQEAPQYDVNNIESEYVEPVE